MKRILFVCTGNTCRSPMAEGLLKLLSGRAGLRVEVRSAGMAASNGSPVSRYAGQLLQEKGAACPAGSSTITREHIEWADLILTMTGGHKRSLISQFPQAVEKTHTLKEYAEDDPRVGEIVQERERLQAELQIKQALGEPVKKEEQEQLRELERQLPDYDIQDPFGGSLDEYRRCAEEIERYLKKLIGKL